ncbi:MAG: hypothetical protein NUW24_17275 [Anaerolineae bacterium]|jgi:di/tricarboxylate transporter|nr:hypothetical protein [Anaerolineae bacterium]MDH7473053.1 hypothetical protein [Anaerolineae bacterium]
MANVTKKKDLLDRIGDFVVHHRGLPVLLGVGLVILNYILAAAWPSAAVAQVSNIFLRFLRFVIVTNLFMHLGVIISLVGILLGDVL